MSADLEVFLKRLHVANARRVWRDLVQRAEKEQWSHEQFLETLMAEEVAHRRGTRLSRAVRAATFPFLRTVEEFDFSYQSTLWLTTIGSLLAPDWVTEARSVVLVVDDVGDLAYGDDAANVVYPVVNDRHVRRRSRLTWPVPNGAPPGIAGG